MSIPRPKPSLRHVLLASLLALPLLHSGPVLGAGWVDSPLSTGAAVVPLEQVGVHRTSVPDREDLAAEDRRRREDGEPFRFALSELVSMTPGSAGTWESLGPDGELWRLRVVCEGAVSLNLGFTRYHLPSDARLLVYAADGSGRVVAFDVQDNRLHGQLWTPILRTDEVVIELVVPAGLRTEVELELGSIGRGYRFFGEDSADKQGSCNIDVVCPEGDPWWGEINSVGVYTINGTWYCSGAMINNTAQDGTPYFLTADHCDISTSNDHSVVVYWNFQSQSCGDLGGGSLADFQSGCTLLAASSASDFKLVELDAMPDPDHNVTYSGWDRSGDVPNSAVTIHHPDCDEKAISFENDPLQITTYQGVAVPGDATHLRIVDWDLGTTEPGSSGAPLYSPGHHIIGQLHGGDAGCNNDESDWYGRLFVSWLGGGTAQTGLQDWLDPLGTGATTLDLYDPGESLLSVSPMTEWNASGQLGGPFSPGTRTFTVTNPQAGSVVVSATTSAGWLEADPVQLTVPGGGSADFEVRFNAAAALLSAGTYSATVTFRDEDADDEIGEIAVNLWVSGDGDPSFLLSTGPNPFVNVLEIHFALEVPAPVGITFHDIRGHLVADLGRWDGVLGENPAVLWAGRDDAGRRLPAGVYFLTLQAGQKETRRRVVMIR